MPSARPQRGWCTGRTCTALLRRPRQAQGHAMLLGRLGERTCEWTATRACASRRSDLPRVGPNDRAQPAVAFALTARTAVVCARSKLVMRVGGIGSAATCRNAAACVDRGRCCAGGAASAVRCSDWRTVGAPCKFSDVKPMTCPVYLCRFRVWHVGQPQHRRPKSASKAVRTGEGRKVISTPYGAGWALHVVCCMLHAACARCMTCPPGKVIFARLEVRFVLELMRIVPNGADSRPSVILSRVVP
jgi:hypothetical protein